MVRCENFRNSVKLLHQQYIIQPKMHVSADHSVTETNPHCRFKYDDAAIMKIV